MKGIKKLACIILSFCMIFAIIGCAQDSGNNSSSTKEPTSSKAPASSEEPSLSEAPTSSSQDQGGNSSTTGQDEKPAYKSLYLNYYETTDFILNPGRGFYWDMRTEVPVSGGKALFNVDWIEGSNLDHFGNPMATWPGKNEQQSYVHIVFSLAAFSAEMGGTDMPLTDDALQSLKLTFDNLRASEVSATIRFTYDPEGKGNKPNEKERPSVEPPFDLVLQHVEQVAKIVAQYKDCIYSIDTGFLGPWGEQHTTKLGEVNEENKETYYRLIETWLEHTNREMNLMVRKPQIFLHWFNTKYNKNYKIENIDTIAKDETAESMLISVWNDGYLYNAEDHGTFTNREKEVAWLSTRTGMYGGEVEAGDLNNFYATGARMVTESFVTHTTHLNSAYDQNVIKSNTKGTAWQQQTYGVGLDSLLIDPLYTGMTYYKYIENHLGYRLVLRKSEMSETVKAGEKLWLKGDIENVGFAPVTTAKKVYVVLTCGNKVSYQEVDFDVRSILSRTTKTYEFAVNIPADFSGNVNAYLKIGSAYDLTKEETKRQIQFANAGNQYNKELGANLIATFNV